MSSEPLAGKGPPGDSTERGLRATKRGVERWPPQGGHRKSEGRERTVVSSEAASSPPGQGNLDVLASKGGEESLIVARQSCEVALNNSIRPGRGSAAGKDGEELPGGPATERKRRWSRSFGEGVPLPKAIEEKAWRIRIGTTTRKWQHGRVGRCGFLLRQFC